MLNTMVHMGTTFRERVKQNRRNSRHHATPSLLTARLSLEVKYLITVSFENLYIFSADVQGECMPLEPINVL